MEDADEFGLTGKTHNGRYHVERLVARGGFGVVYLATHLGLGKRVALKVMRRPDSIPVGSKAYQKVWESFEQEARIVVTLRNHNICRVMDFGKDPLPNGDVAPWMALEWLDGQTLREYLMAPGALPMRPRDAVALLRGVFEGLIEAHEQKIAHRDIKPGNIMVLSSPSLQCVLMDFGIAKLMEAGEAEANRTAQRERHRTSPPTRSSTPASNRSMHSGLARGRTATRWASFLRKCLWASPRTETGPATKSR